MTFCLESTIVKPNKDKDITSAVVLLHGYGGDGKDISMLSLNWKRHMPNTIFLCPNGHETCEINPTGYQWFDLTKDDPGYILEESLKAEKKINKFLVEVREKYNLENRQICLSGFSQGCMMYPWYWPPRATVTFFFLPPLHLLLFPFLFFGFSSSSKNI